MFSSAESIGSRLKNWKTKPMCSRRSLVRSVSPRSVISVPAISTLPDVGWSSPARMCIRVDFPEPDGPITAVSAPFGTLTETPRSASTAVSPAPYRRVTSVATTTGPFSRAWVTTDSVSVTSLPPRQFHAGVSPFQDTRAPYGYRTRRATVGPEVTATSARATDHRRALRRLGQHVTQNSDDLVHLVLAGDERRRDLHDRVTTVVLPADQAGVEQAGER